MVKTSMTMGWAAVVILTLSAPAGAQVTEKLKEAGVAVKSAGREVGKAGKAVGEATAEGAKEVAGKTKDVTTGTGKAVEAGAKVTASGTKDAVTGVADNTLTAPEQAEGWRLLFDGTSLAGWRGYRQTSAPAGWQVVDGAITRVGKGGDLVTAETFSNFELKIDFRIAANGNSGIFYRGVESADGPIYRSAPEYQVLDNAGHPDAKNGPDRFCGGNYALEAPSNPGACKPAGEWNSARIVVNGAHVEHWLNGEKMVEYDLWSDTWKAQVAASKFKEWPTYGMSKSGLIALQDHGNDVGFKNIKVKVLKSGTSE
jgi:Domain of Unknown Function (DUF1080)